MDLSVVGLMHCDDSVEEVISMKMFEMEFEMMFRQRLGERDVCRGGSHTKDARTYGGCGEIKRRRQRGEDLGGTETSWTPARALSIDRGTGI